tara:strand:- start:1064 stop:1330 length:267 start_codon:yes stop_codon:yes gene_type:complete
VKIGDLVCFKWHAAFLDPNETLGDNYGTDHIPIGLVTAMEIEIEYRRPEYDASGVSIAKIMWQRTPGKSPVWKKYNDKIKIKILRVIG